MSLNPSRRENEKTAMIDSGPTKNVRYQASAGSDNQAGYLGPLTGCYAALNSVQARSRSFVPSGVTLFGSRFSSVGSGGKTSSFANTFLSITGSSRSRFTGEP